MKGKFSKPRFWIAAKKIILQMLPLSWKVTELKLEFKAVFWKLSITKGRVAPSEKSGPWGLQLCNSTEQSDSDFNIGSDSHCELQCKHFFTHVH